MVRLDQTTHKAPTCSANHINETVQLMDVDKLAAVARRKEAVARDVTYKKAEKKQIR